MVILMIAFYLFAAVLVAWLDAYERSPTSSS